ncbi:hypothetical protein Tco_1483100, partial [Tanacetum coccineum]
MGEPLSPDRVFNFPADEPEPHPAYDFFAPRPLPGVVANEPMVGLIVDEIAEPVVKVEEQVVAPVVGMDEDIAMLFGDDGFKDDDSDGFDKEEVWEVNEEWLMAPTTPPLMSAVQPLSVYRGTIFSPPSTWTSYTSISDRGLEYPL